MGRARGTDAEYAFDCAGTPGIFPQRDRLGTIYGCGHCGSQQTGPPHCVSSLGKSGTKKSGNAKQPAAPDPEIAAPKPAVCLPGIFRMQAFQPGKRVSGGTRRDADRLADQIKEYTPLKKMRKEQFSAVSAVLAVVFLYAVMEAVGITCPIKFVTGISCAGCGMSRAWLSVLRLDLQKSFYYHPLFWLPPVFLIVVFLKKHMSKRTYQTIMFTILSIYVIIYLYRLILGNNDIVVFQPENNIVFRIIRKLYS